MKANKSSKNFKTATRILTIVICIGLAFSLTTIETSNAFVFTLGIVIGLLITGGVIGWCLHEQSNSENVGDNPALKLTEENILTAWQSTAETISNQYKENNVDVQNFVNLFNVSYLYWVRQAEHDVANVISSNNWYDAKTNMTTFDDFDDSIKDLILSQLAKYSAQDVYTFRNILETNAKDTVDIVDVNGSIIDSSFTYGLRPMVSDRNTDWYLISIYVPADTSLKVDGNLYTEGVYQFHANEHTISEVTSDSILITGFPTDYDIFSKKYYNLTNERVCGDKSIHSGGATSFTNIYINRKIDKIDFDITTITGASYVDWIDLYGNSHRIGDSVGQFEVYPHAYVKYIEICVGGGGHDIVITPITVDINYHDIFYRPEPVTLTVKTSLAGDVELAQYLTDRDLINFYDMIIPYMKTIKDAMELNAQTLFNLYHSHGWFSTDDIPSNYLVVMPDLVFDNIFALADINITEAMLIYYTLLKQLDNQTLWTESDIDSSDISISDFGKWMVKGKLTHASDVIFDNEWVWIIPQTESLVLENNTNVSLTQSVMFFIPSTQEMFMGYSGDTLHIYSLLEDGESSENITITRMTLSEFLIATYGFDISLFEEWEFPLIPEGSEIYLIIAVGLIAVGVIVWLLGGDKYKKFGILTVVVGAGILILVYVIPAIIDFVVFW